MCSKNILLCLKSVREFLTPLTMDDILFLELASHGLLSCWVIGIITFDNISTIL